MHLMLRTLLMLKHISSMDTIFFDIQLLTDTLEIMLIFICSQKIVIHQ